MKTKTVIVEVTLRITYENGMETIDTYPVLVNIDKTETPLGSSNYYVNICKAASKYVHAKIAQANPRCKVFTRFTNYVVIQVSDIIYSSDLKEDGYMD